MPQLIAWTAAPLLFSTIPSPVRVPPAGTEVEATFSVADRGTRDAVRGGLVRGTDGWVDAGPTVTLVGLIC